MKGAVDGLMQVLDKVQAMLSLGEGKPSYLADLLSSEPWLLESPFEQLRTGFQSIEDNLEKGCNMTSDRFEVDFKRLQELQSLLSS